jgi:hypothetical protein
MGRFRVSGRIRCWTPAFGNTDFCDGLLDFFEELIEACGVVAGIVAEQLLENRNQAGAGGSGNVSGRVGGAWLRRGLEQD